MSHGYYVMIHDAAESPEAPLPACFRCYDEEDRDTAFLLRDHLRGLAGEGVKVEVECLDQELEPPDLNRLRAGVR